MLGTAFVGSSRSLRNSPPKESGRQNLPRALHQRPLNSKVQSQGYPDTYDYCCHPGYCGADKPCESDDNRCFADNTDDRIVR